VGLLACLGDVKGAPHDDINPDGAGGVGLGHLLEPGLQLFFSLVISEEEASVVVSQAAVVCHRCHVMHLARFLHQATIHAYLRLPYMLSASGYHTCLFQARLNRFGSAVQPPGSLNNISASASARYQAVLCFSTIQFHAPCNLTALQHLKQMISGVERRNHCFSITLDTEKNCAAHVQMMTSCHELACPLREQDTTFALNITIPTQSI